jgi:multimeric flavodoxin WrbA
MKILGINSSPRGKSSRTLQLVNAVLDGAKERGAKPNLLISVYWTYNIV